MVPLVEVNIKHYQTASCQARHQIPETFTHTQWYHNTASQTVSQTDEGSGSTAALNGR